MAKKKQNKTPDVVKGTEVLAKTKAPKKAKLAAKTVAAEEKYVIVRTEESTSSAFNMIESVLDHAEEIEDKYGALEENCRVMLTKAQVVTTLQEELDERSKPSEFSVYKLTPVKISLSPRVVTPAVVKVN